MCVYGCRLIFMGSRARLEGVLCTLNFSRPVQDLGMEGVVLELVLGVLGLSLAACVSATCLRFVERMMEMKSQGTWGC